jgi:hypothetical protein
MYAGQLATMTPELTHYVIETEVQLSKFIIHHQFIQNCVLFLAELQYLANHSYVYKCVYFISNKP